MIRKLRVIVVGSIIVGVLGTGLYFGLRAAHGAFNNYYYVTADVARAGQQLQRGTDVRIRGVKVGKVVEVDLVDRRARLTLQIEDEFKVPATAEAVVTLKTLLGSKFVDLRFEATDDSPLLADGYSISRTTVGPELEDALDDGVSVLEALEPADLTTVVSELARASNGHGEDVARGLAANAELSELFAGTLEPQISALDDLRVLFSELESKGDDMNALAGAVNEGVPVYASEEAARDLRAALEGLVPFTNDVADLVIFNRRSLDRLIVAGDRVLATVAGRPAGLAGLVTGLRTYVTKLGQSVAHNLLPDGSASAGFVNFVGGNDLDETVEQLCFALAPEERGRVPICGGPGR